MNEVSISYATNQGAKVLSIPVSDGVDGIGTPGDCHVLPVVMFTDYKYMGFAVRSIYSLFKHHTAGQKVVCFLYLICNKLDLQLITLKEFSFLRSFSPDCTLVVSELPEVLRLELDKLNSHTPDRFRNAPVKFLVPDLFPDLGWAFVCDVDTIFIDDPRKGLAGFKEDFPVLSGAIDVNAKDYYINAGVLLMNLKKARETGFVSRCVEDYVAHGKDDNPNAEQDCFKRLYDSEMRSPGLPTSLNFCPLSEDDPIFDIGNAIVLHYYGSPKLFDRKFQDRGAYCKRCVSEAEIFSKLVCSFHGFDGSLEIY